MFKLALVTIFLSCSTLALASELPEHDPTMPLNISNPYLPSVGNLQVDAIFFNKNHSSAIINGHSYSVGDTIFTNKIIAINKNSVKLQDKNNEFTLELSYSNITTPAVKPNHEKKDEKAGA